MVRRKSKVSKEENECLDRNLYLILLLVILLSSRVEIIVLEWDIFNFLRIVKVFVVIFEAYY